MMKKDHESAIMEILKEFGTLLTVKGCSERVFYRELSNEVLQSL